MRYPDVGGLWLCPQAVEKESEGATQLVQVTFANTVATVETYDAVEDESEESEGEIELVAVAFVGSRGNVTEYDLRTGLPWGVSQDEFNQRNGWVDRINPRTGLPWGVSQKDFDERNAEYQRRKQQSLACGSSCL